jgi:hypothetical protein
VIAVAEPLSELVRLLDEQRSEARDALGCQPGGWPGDGECGERVAAWTEDRCCDRREPVLELVDARRIAARPDTGELVVELRAIDDRARREAVERRDQRRAVREEDLAVRGDVKGDAAPDPVGDADDVRRVFLCEVLDAERPRHREIYRLARRVGEAAQRRRGELEECRGRVSGREAEQDRPGMQPAALAEALDEPLALERREEPGGRALRQPGAGGELADRRRVDRFDDAAEKLRSAVDRLGPGGLACHLRSWNRCSTEIVAASPVGVNSFKTRCVGTDRVEVGTIVNVPIDAPVAHAWSRWRAAPLARPQRLVLSCLVAAGSIVSVLILWAGRGESFFSDDWAFVVGRRGWTPDAFLLPHGEHIAVLPAAIYKLLFLVVGLHAYWPYRCVLLLVHLACVALVFRLARRRVGEPSAALAAMFVLVLGTAWELLLFPFAMNLSGSIALGLLALDGLDRGGRRGDIVALLALTGAACSSSAGVPFVAGVATELVLRRAWRKLWIVAVPTLLYGAWWLAYGRAATARDHLLSQLHVVPGYIVHSIEVAVLVAVPLPMSSVPLVLALVALLVIVRVVHTPQVLTPRLGGLVVAALAFWSLTGLARAHLGVGENRYPYFGVVFLLLATVELLRGMRLDRRIGVGLCVVLALSSIVNFRSLVGGGGFLREHASSLRAELTALSTLDKPPPANFVPEPAWAPNLAMGDYRAAVQELGSPAESLAALAAASEDVREAADRLILRAEPTTTRTVSGNVCATPSTSIHLRPHQRRLLVVAAEPFTLQVRLFAAEFSRTGAIVVGRGTHELLLPAVDGAARWHAYAAAPARICA